MNKENEVLHDAIGLTDEYLSANRTEPMLEMKESVKGLNLMELDAGIQKLCFIKYAMQGERFRRYANQEKVGKLCDTLAGVAAAKGIKEPKIDEVKAGDTQKEESKKAKPFPFSREYIRSMQEGVK